MNRKFTKYLGGLTKCQMAVKESKDFLTNNNKQKTELNTHSSPYFSNQW